MARLVGLNPAVDPDESHHRFLGICGEPQARI